MASCLMCNFCQKRMHMDVLCVLNPGSQNFKKDLVCQTCGVRGHSSKVCNEVIRAAVKNTGNKPFPNYSVWRRSLEMACQRRTSFRCKRNKGIYYQKFRCNQEGGGVETGTTQEWHLLQGATGES